MLLDWLHASHGQTAQSLSTRNSEQAAQAEISDQLTICSMITSMTKTEKQNRAVVQKLIDCINQKNIVVMDELFHEDAVMDWPQSGEKIVGGSNRRAVYGSFPTLPTIVPRCMVSGGNLVVAEATLDYGSPTRYKAVFIFEFSDGKITKETAYWSEPFEAPEWRAQWVEKNPS